MNNAVRQEGVGTSVKQFDRSCNHYRETIQLEPSGLYYLSIFTTPEGQFIQYSFDVEAAFDSHYTLSSLSEWRLRAMMRGSGSRRMTLAEAMIEFLRTSSGGTLERLVKSVCVEQFHYYDYDFDDD